MKKIIMKINNDSNKNIKNNGNKLKKWLFTNIIQKIKN